MRLRVVLNARSGTLRDLDPDEVAARISDLCRAAGHDATVVAAAPDTVPAELRAAAAADIDAVIVGGGDGTVSSAANLLAGTGKALGVLPLGTMNLFARDLDLPTEWEAALAALIDGEIIAIDVGELAGRAFLTFSALGLYALAVQDRERQRTQSGRGKWPAMLIAVLRTLWRNPELRLEIEADGQRRRVRTSALVVTNNRYELGFPDLMARKAIDGGILGLYVARERTRLGMVRLLVRTFLGRAGRPETLAYSEHQEITIHTTRDYLTVANDGEVLRVRPPLVYRVRPGALRVLSPRRSAEL